MLVSSIGRVMSHLPAKITVARKRKMVMPQLETFHQFCKVQLHYVYQFDHAEADLF